MTKFFGVEMLFLTPYFFWQQQSLLIKLQILGILKNKGTLLEKIE